MIIPLTERAYQAAIGHNLGYWERWYTDEGFTVDERTNLLARDGRLWRLNRDAQRLEPIPLCEQQKLHAMQDIVSGASSPSLTLTA